MVLGRDLTGQCMIRSCIVDHGSAIIVKLKGTIPDKSTETGVKKKIFYDLKTNWFFKNSNQTKTHKNVQDYIAPYLMIPDTVYFYGGR